MLSWFRRRKKHPFDPAWREILSANVWQYPFLSTTQHDRVHATTATMVAEKHWDGGNDLEVTEEMRVTISGIASLLTLGLDEPFFFNRLKTVIIYEGGYKASRHNKAGILSVGSDPIFGGINRPSSRLGEAWQWGPVVLSWQHTLGSSRSPGDGDNLVLHEFAHHLDGLDGSMDGAPTMPKRHQQRQWYEVTDAEYYRLVGQSQRQEVTLLDHYGATNRAEFFAVSTECFFEQPHELKTRHAKLFDMLAALYKQDPTEWIPQPQKKVTEQATKKGSEQDDGKLSPQHIDLNGLGLKGADEWFVLGNELMNCGEHHEAIIAFTRAIDLAPDDAEAFASRSWSRLALNDKHGAISDAEKALLLDPDDHDVQLALAQAHLALEDYQSAEPLIKQALRTNRNSFLAWLMQGDIHFHYGRHHQAERSLREAISLEPYFASTYSQLADVLETLGKPDEALRQRQRAEQLDPSVIDDKM